MSIITIQYVVDALNPTAAGTRFLSSTLGESATTKMITRGQSVLQAYLPVQYQQFFTRIEGLILTRSAMVGENQTFTLPLVCQTASAVRVWVNLDVPYRDRIRRDPVASTTNGTAITLTTPLSDGDIAVADVTHNGANVPELLKQLLTDIVVSKLKLEYMQSLALDGAQHANAQDLMERTREDLLRLQSGKLRIHEWDVLDLHDDNETMYDEHGIGTVSPLGW